MLRRLFVALVGFAAAVALTTPLSMAQDANPWSAAMSCDCGSINAGVLTGSWKKDCGACEKRILEKCAQSYEQHGSMERALREAGFCRRDCSAYGEGAFPNMPPAKKPSGLSAGPVPPPPSPGSVQLLCAKDAPPRPERIGALEFTGCKDKKGRRNGLWTTHDSARKVVIEIIFKDGREISRRERKAG